MREILPKSQREKMSGSMRSHAQSSRARVKGQAKTAGPMVAEALATGSCLFFTAHTSLGGVAVAAQAALGADLKVWCCSANLGACQTLSRTTTKTEIIVDESIRRRTENPEWLAEAQSLVDMRFGTLHTKGFVCGNLVCLSSCNLSRGCGVEHYDLFVDAELASRIFDEVADECGAKAIDLDHGRNIKR